MKDDIFETAQMRYPLKALNAFLYGVIGWFIFKENETFEAFLKLGGLLLVTIFAGYFHSGFTKELLNKFINKAYFDTYVTEKDKDSSLKYFKVLNAQIMITVFYVITVFKVTDPLNTLETIMVAVSITSVAIMCALGLIKEKYLKKETKRYTFVTNHLGLALVTFPIYMVFLHYCVI